MTSTARGRPTRKHAAAPPVEDRERPSIVDGFLTDEKADRNAWWRLESGHHLNLFEAAVEERDAALARLATAEGERDRLADALRKVMQYEGWGDAEDLLNTLAATSGEAGTGTYPVDDYCDECGGPLYAEGPGGPYRHAPGAVCRRAADKVSYASGEAGTDPTGEASEPVSPQVAGVEGGDFDLCKCGEILALHRPFDVEHDFVPAAGTDEGGGTT